MADATQIEWTDATWQIVTGCSVVSPGCTNCYAMRLAGTRLQHHPSRAGLTTASKAGPVWNGQVRFNAEWLTQPLRWTRPRRIFVAAHGDLFHEGVTDDWLDQILAVMGLAHQHTFQVLTKRPERMREYLSSPALLRRILDAAFRLDCQRGAWMSADHQIAGDPILPLPNVWLGVSVEDQERANQRVPELMATPAAVRWISGEPLLGPVDLSWALSRNRLDIAIGFQRRGHFSPGLETLRPIDWVVAGGESGPGSRPMHPDWGRQLRDQCAAAGVPFLFKQWGDWAADGDVAAHGGHDSLTLDDDTPAGQVMFRVGKKAAGRHLDGALHDAFPASAP